MRLATSLSQSVVGSNPQSFQFLVDVSEFQKSIRTQDGKDDFEGFLAIVKEYIKNSSDSEINIDHHTKKEILKFGERSAYISLNTVRRARGLPACRKTCC